MSYQHGRTTAPTVGQDEAHIRAKFEYFRKAEAQIDVGPVKVEYHPLPLRKRGARAECGTHSGYKTHITNRTEPCQPCREARALYQRSYRAQRRVSQAA